MPATARLFLALWPDDTVRDQLLAWRDAWQWPRGATPVHAAHLHQTLHFIGATARELLPKLRGTLRAPITPFRLTHGTPALWPHGIAVLEPLSAPPELAALHAALGARLHAAGLTPDARPYKPHVTMARRAAGALPPAQGPAIDWHVDSYALMESRDGHYEVVERYG